ncbi:MAG: L,D-transpeptidase family protein [Desulfomonilia bacterium]|jgi:murein L,D-transpeptidase YcbB/YkuD
MSLRILIALLLVFMLMPAGTGRAQPPDDAVAGIIREKLGGAPVAGGLSVGTCQISSLKVMPELYERRGYRPIWVKPQAIDDLIHVIEETYEDGLDPQDYHLDEIRQAMIDAGKSTDPLLAASRDLLLTDAFIRLANHSNCGKEDPVSHHPQWNLDRKIDDADPVLFIEKAIESPSIMQTIDKWKIRHPSYSRLKTALAEYRAIKARGGWETVPSGRTLRKGMIDPRVKTLSSRLAVTGDLQGEAAYDPMTFDRDLEQALIHFQHRHGLKEDGVAGKGTLEALNIPVEYRIDQIRVNLERARWVLHDLGDTFVLVDIAGFQVYFQKDDKIIWSCRAQVGQPYRDTPVFKSSITYVELNPPWVVPPTIFVKDILPAVRKDMGYLQKKNIMVLDGKGREVNPKTINWSLYPGRPFPYTLRQNPGEGSALGRLKISFPNRYLVYLHDTPHKELFEKEDRTFSSGCIRLEKPFELAELLLNDPSKWNLDNIMKAIESGKTRDVPLSKPVAILLLYWTVTVDEGGVIYFKKDPYHEDNAVLEDLGRDSEIKPFRPLN